MIKYTITTATRDAIAGAITSFLATPNPLVTAGLGKRVKVHFVAPATAGQVGVWPADEDGLHRVVLDAAAALIAWRSFIVAEIAAGRGAFDGGYGDLLGIKTRPAYDYVHAVTRGHHINPVRKMVIGGVEKRFWTDLTDWVLDPDNAERPKGRYASSAFARRASTGDAYRACGLVIGGRTWCPKASALFEEPVPEVPAPTLSPVDDAAIANLAC